MLVDSTDELFNYFPLFIHDRVKGIVRAMHSRQLPISTFGNLAFWYTCDFTGEENFSQVQLKLSDYVQDIRDYLAFILDIPFLNDLLRVADASTNKYVCVTLVMSVQTFKRFCLENALPDIDEYNNLGNEANRNPGSEAAEDAVLSEEQVEAEVAWKDAFYSTYQEKFNKMKNTTLITKEKYERIVSILLEYKRLRRRGPYKGPAPKEAVKFSKIYEMRSNIGNRCLYRNNLIVTTYEDVFDVMKAAHVALGHARDIKKNKQRLDQEYYSIPESCIRKFLDLCPFCIPAETKRDKHKVPLKMILTPRVGHQAQIDLIDMGALAIDGTRCILRYVDHLSGFLHAHPMRSKTAEECGINLLKILSTSVIPEIIQSDNGIEFLG